MAAPCKFLAAAKAAGSKTYFTGRPCVKGHISERYVSTRSCVECFANYRSENYEASLRREARWRSKNRAVANERSAAWRKENPDRQRAAETAYRANNPDKRKVSCATYRAANLDKEKEYARKWRDENKPRLAAKAAARRALRIKATPPWADPEKIQEAYDLAAVLAEDTGSPWHVDHIFPLKHPLACGLHCETNLQVLPAFNNLSKSNRVDPSVFEPKKIG